ncbi:DUF3927 domain-containing protein [Shewanella sp. 1180_01]
MLLMSTCDYHLLRALVIAMCALKCSTRLGCI